MTDTPPQTQWYIARDGKQNGPITDEEMRILVQGGFLLPTDLIWRSGFDDWQLAQNVFPRPAPPPAPAPPPEPQPVAPQSPAAPQPQPTAVAPVRPASVQQSAPGSAAAADPTSGRSASARMPREPATGALDRSQTQTGAPRRPARDTSRASGRAQNAVAPILDDPEPLEPRRSRSGRVVALVFVLAVIGGGAFLAYQSRDTLMAAIGGSSGAEDKAPPIVKADGTTKTAALEEANAPQPEDAPAQAAAPAEPAEAAGSSSPPAEPVFNTPGIITTLPPAIQPPAAPGESQAVAVLSPDVIDANFQKSPLWALMKREFPEWYAERIAEVAQMSGGRQDTDVTKHLIRQLVLLRRRNAEHALSASTDRLRSIATAFLANLKTLSGHSTEACYTFISHGEASKEVVTLFNETGYSEGIEAHIAAIFSAVADGRSTPIKRERAAKAEYDVLAAQLQKMGWTRTDLKLFASPDELAKAPREQVCKMVQDWFAAHIAIPDAGVQERLLYETLRPVVAG